MSDHPPAVAIIPYGQSVIDGIDRLPLDSLHWPLGCPDRLASGTVAVMGPHDHLIAFPDKKLYLLPRGSRRAQLSLMIVEPDASHGRHYTLLWFFRKRFFRILTKNPKVLHSLPNAAKFVFGSTFVPEWRDIETEKTRHISLIASDKRKLEGHALRHSVVDHSKALGLAVDVMGRGYRPIGRKSEGLAPYRFSVVIENVQEPSYFTEKLVDALLCRCIPIYWGAPDISDYFDPRGMIICDTEDQIIAALQNANDQTYASMLPYVERNREAAAIYADFMKRAAQIVLDAATGINPTAS